MTNHNSAANAVRSLRKKIECHYYPDGVPPTATPAPKKRGKAAKAVDGDDAEANEENADSKPTTKKKRAPKKKANVTSANGINGDGGDGNGDDAATTPTEKDSNASASPKRKSTADEDGSPKKKVRETKVKSEEYIKEEEGSSEGMHHLKHTWRLKSKSFLYVKFCLLIFMSLIQQVKVQHLRMSPHRTTTLTRIMIRMKRPTIETMTIRTRIMRLLRISS